MDLAGLIGTYGYPLVFLGAVLEGEAVVIAAGYVAHRQHMPLAVVVSCAALGGTLGDLGYFMLGRRYGERALLDSPASLRSGAARARAAVHRNPIRVLLSMRFLYGLRIALPMLCGASPMRLRRFLAYDVATAIVWATCFATIGYAFGAAATAMLGRLERYEWVVVAALGLLAVALHAASKRLSAWRQPSRDAPTTPARVPPHATPRHD